LTNPRLFDAQPDGTWRAALVQPGSDHATKDGRTASFKLRDAKWSNGTPITVEDLQRTHDARFVDRVDETNGVVHVHLKQKLPGWRMLWSDVGIAPPAERVSGGPFIVDAVVSGDKTVLKRNDTWWGSAFLDEIRLQYVPDSITARQLLQRHDVDVVAPAADTVRTQHFQSDGVKVDTRKDGGVWTALQFNTSNVPQQTRVAAFATFPRDVFVKSLLANEASIDAAWGEPPASNERLDTLGLAFTSPVENPLSTPLDAALERALQTKGGSMHSRATDEATVNQLVSAKTYDVAFVTHHDGPEVCWQCAFSEVDATLATKADAGNANAAKSIQQKAVSQGAMLPLWREFPFVAYVSANVDGIHANGYANTDAWSAATWWKP
jgi:ABC-type transport system substrate-binding protein